MQVKRAARVWAGLMASALVGAVLGAVPASATTGTTTASGPSGTVVAPSSTAVLTGRVGLTDDAVYAETADGVVTLARDGSATDWAPVTAGGTRLAGHLLQAEGDALLVADLDGNAETLAWRADDGAWGTRTVPTGTTLGHGGLFALLPPVPATSGDSRSWSAEDVRTGAVSPVYEDWLPSGLAIDGSTLWTTGGYAGTLLRIDIPTGTRTAVGRGTGTQSDGLLLGVGWAVTTDVRGRHTVVDTRPTWVYRNWQLPTEDQALDGLAVGERTVVGLRATTTPGEATIAVRALAGDRSERTFGPATAAGSLDLDDGGRTVAYLDPDGRVRTVDLGWATAPATTPVDHEAPAVPSLSLAPLTATTVTVYASLPADTASTPFVASGADRQETRYRVTADGGAAGAWQTGPVGLRTSTTTTVRTTPHHTVCVEARNHDVAGNYSAWSAPACGRVDETAPRLTKVTGSASTTRAVKGKATAKITYAATDNLEVASYDVRYKKAPKGKTTYGAWVYPASWQRTTTTSRSVTATSGQRVCLSVRARDAAGNVSAWSASRCTYADGTAPKMTKATTIHRYYAYKKAWDKTLDGKQQTTFTFAGKDDRSSLRYQVQYRYPIASTPWQAAVYPDGWTTKHSVTRTVGPGDEICFRVRAKDAVGNIGAWSGTHCVNVMGGMFTDSVSSGYDHLSKDLGGYRTTYSVVGHAVRLHVKKRPKGGAFAVYVGSTKIGTVKTASSKTHWAYVVVRVAKHHRGKVRLKPLTKAVAQVHDYTVIY